MSLAQVCLGLSDALFSFCSLSQLAWVVSGPGRAAGLCRGGRLQCHPGKVFELSLF